MVTQGQRGLEDPQEGSRGWEQLYTTMALLTLGALGTMQGNPEHWWGEVASFS